MISRRQFFKLSAATGIGLAAGSRIGFPGIRPAFAQIGQGLPLPGNQIPQFVDPLPQLQVVDGTSPLTIRMKEFQADVMPSNFAPAAGAYQGTWVWGYQTDGYTPLPGVNAPFNTYINPVIVAQRNVPTEITWVNELGFASPGTGTGSQVGAWVSSTDQTLHWADPKMEMGSLVNYAGPIPTVVHLHGGEVPPELDGGPDAWFLSQAQNGYMAHGHAYYSKDDPSNAGTSNYSIYRYPNTQEHANIWFHDHALGITRLNVYAGLAGAYLLVDPSAWRPAEPKPDLIPLVIQDRKFDINGQLFFDNIGLNPEHPFWVPEFVGDTIVVNGKVWPYKTVDRKRYTLFFLNGSNARFYDMFFIDPVSGVKGPPMYVISTDGGYLDTPVLLDPNAGGKGGAKSLILAPGERYEVVVDFGDATWLANITAGYAALGQPVPPTISLHLRNNARTPFPGGAPAPNSTTGRIIEFRVSQNAPLDTSFNPATLAALRNQSIIRLPATPKGPAVSPGPIGSGNVQVIRQLTLNEVMGPGGPLEVLVNNTKWSGKSPRPYGDFYYDAPSDTFYSETPKEGDTEMWEIINLTADAHPIHLHLVQFQLVNRQGFDIAAYTAAYNAAFPAVGDLVGGAFVPAFGPPLHYYTGAGNHATYGMQIWGGNPDVTPFLKPKKWPAVPPLPNEEGWKDTVVMYPGEVARIIVRWAPTDVALGDTANEHFAFSPDGGHGFVWHCHIIDHEDNEMMRPDLVLPKAGAPRIYVGASDGGTDF